MFQPSYLSPIIAIVINQTSFCSYSCCILDIIHSRSCMDSLHSQLQFILLFISYVLNETIYLVLCLVACCVLQICFKCAVYIVFSSFSIESVPLYFLSSFLFCFFVPLFLFVHYIANYSFWVEHAS